MRLLYVEKFMATRRPYQSLNAPLQNKLPDLIKCRTIYRIGARTTAIFDFVRTRKRPPSYKVQGRNRPQKTPIAARFGSDLRGRRARICVRVELFEPSIAKSQTRKN
jgi:hypothetical protein